MVQLPTIAEEEAAAVAATQHPPQQPTHSTLLHGVPVNHRKDKEPPQDLMKMLHRRNSLMLLIWKKKAHLLIIWLLWDSRDTKLPWHLPVQNLREIFKPLYN